jgi:replicative DNA helicase
LRELTPEEQAALEDMTDPGVIKPKFSWDDTFQRKLLGMLLIDQYMLVQAIDKVKPEYFSNDAHVLISRILLKYFEKFKSIPNKWIIEQELRNNLKDRDNSVQLHYLAELSCVYDYYVPGLEAREYLIEKVTYFAKVQAIKIAFHASLEKMQEAPEDEKTWNFIYDKMRESMLVDRSYEPGLEYFLQIDEMFKRMDNVFVGKDRFTSGFESIDQALTGGGMFAGQIASWIGLPGTGKSLALVRSAVQNVLLGHKVLYLTMEMDELGIAQRFTSQLAKVDINSLRDSRSHIEETIKNFGKDKEDLNLLHIKQFPGGVMDVNGIRAFMAQLELRNWKPNLLIVDYVGEMKDDPTVKKYESAYRILRDLRGFGVEKQHCTFTCVQPNSSASKLEIGQFIDESNIGTSFDQFKPLDAFWSINQQTIEKDAEVGRVFVIKHRNGRSRFSLKIGFDYSLGTLDMFEVSPESYRSRMNMIQEKKTSEVVVDGEVGGKQKSRTRFKPKDEVECIKEFDPKDLESEDLSGNLSASDIGDQEA